MLLSNLVSLIKNDADEEIDITSKSSNKFRYQANRAFIIGRIKIIFPKILCDLSELSVIEKLSGAVHSSFPVDHFQEKN